ncbi:MAG TPA: peptide ABC transporter substrate-binding protein [Rhizomicrobium sp.]|jgi:oligopeptide transport system substrate-binding protein|nr:peptide ABC transporter substrate-binding protein [Rhizomicrobium sp.]
MTSFRLGALALGLLLAACSPPSDQHLTTLDRGNGSDIKSLDPAFIQGNWEAWLLGDVIVGLTTEGPRSEPIPGAATSWDVSRDGLTWTFHLRQHVWSDGVPVTAADFVTAWRRVLDPKTGAPYAYALWVVKNAYAVSTGKLPPSALGIRAPDDATLVVRLEHPAPYLAELMDHEVAWPIPRHLYLKLGDAWARPANHVGNGPYMVKEWIPLDHVTLVKNPRFYDAAHVQIDVVRYYATNDSQAALRRFRAGELDTVNPFPNQQIDWMRSHMPGALRIEPYLGIAYTVMNFQRPPFRDIRLREAINLAMDRENLTRRVRRIGETPAYNMLPPGVANYPGGAAMPFKAMPYAERVVKAQGLMRAMGYGPAHRLHLDFTTSTNPDSILNAVNVQAMLSKIYIDVSLDPVENQIFLVKMQQHDFDLGGASWIADFNDASNFLDLLRTGAGENYGQYSNKAYDALMDKAQLQTDPKARGATLEKAEQMALNDYAWVPMYFMVTRDLVQPYVKGWIPNAKDFNRTRWLRVEGKP